MKTVGIAILALIALLAGLCSLRFVGYVPLAFNKEAYKEFGVLAALPIAGFIVAALCIVWINKLLRTPSRPTPNDQPAPPSTDDDKDT